VTDQTKFTIVIPTRERCRYLVFALRTCVSQDYDNFEVIVSDNFSQDDTKETVAAFRDDRIRYLNTGRRLSMSDNWEFALSHVERGYVMFLGDDDGILPGGLREVDEIVRTTRCQAVTGQRATYAWPDYPIGELRNILYVPLQRSVRRIRSCDAVKNVLAFRQSYRRLPMLYYGFVHMDLIRKAKEESQRFFLSMIPDVYSGLAIAFVTDHYYYTSRPFVIGGGSGASTGAAYSVQGTEHESAVTEQAARLLMGEDALPFHPRLVFCKSSPILVAEAFLQAREHVSGAEQFDIDLKLVMRAAAREAAREPPAIYRSVMEAIVEIGNRNKLEAFASRLVSSTRNRPKPLIRPPTGYSFISRRIILDCAEFGVSDIYDASLLCRHAVALKESGYFSALGCLRALLVQFVAWVRRRFL